MRRLDAAFAGAVVLFVVYALTLAPDVTFWDAGEFITAAHALGIPHPPGTPLFVLIANVWARVLPLPFALATNVLSAVATAVAAGVSARLVYRGTSSSAMTFAAAITAGGMSSAWLNATETEVYALSLLLGMLTIWAGERAGREDALKWPVLTAYLMALAVPLHLSALVTAPVAITLAALTPRGMRWRRVAALSGVFFVALGVGRMSPWLSGTGVALLALAPLAPSLDADTHARRIALSVALLAVAVVGCSAIAFLVVRARLDPWLNQGNPDTIERFVTVVSRRQYAVAPLWPRMAPPWVQVSNVFQYADWQTALSTGPTVLPSILRTLFTVSFLGLGYIGALWHRNADRRSWNAIAGLFVCGTIGVLVYLNLHAGPSFGFPGFARDAFREARERDYFFVFGFWAWGLWAGIGAVVVARYLRRPAWAGVLVAALPIVLNWRAVTRRADPERELPRRWAEMLLESTPNNGVLFVSGDNDTYPVWYVQEVHGYRRDVAIVVLPLLTTGWYRDEMARRHGFASANRAPYAGRFATATAIMADARAAGRPVAASVTLTPGERDRLSKRWRAGGVAYVEGAEGIDSVSAARWAAWVEQRLPAKSVRPQIDPVSAYFRQAMECPKQYAAAARSGDTSQLDSACNYR